MKRTNDIYKLENKVASIFMVVALLWLTISLPFVNAAQQQQAYSVNMTADEEPPSSEQTNPFGNTTEEKAESGSGSLSEYLHHMNELVHPSASQQPHNPSHDVDVYVAFHGEMLCPPPNFILA